MSRQSAPRGDVWLTADLAVRLLHQEATRTGDTRLRIQQPTLRQWVRRQHIQYDRARGYNVASIIAYVTGRGTRGQRPRQLDQHERDVSPSLAVPPLCPASRIG